MGLVGPGGGEVWGPHILRSCHFKIAEVSGIITLIAGDGKRELCCRLPDRQLPVCNVFVARSYVAALNLWMKTLGGRVAEFPRSSSEPLYEAYTARGRCRRPPLGSTFPPSVSTLHRNRKKTSLGVMAFARAALRGVGLF